jgi:putative ABC transport system permease protein
MLKNYLKTALRSLMKNKAFSLINITGLALGTLCCLYMVLYVMDQYSYDRHHAGAKDIYRITSRLFVGGDSHQNATMSPPVAPAMKADFGEVVQYTRVVPALGISKHILEYGDKSFYEKSAVYVDSTFFDVFAYHFTHRAADALLNEPYTVVLQKSVSDKLFGTADPVNKTITINNAYGRHDFKVTGVVDETLGKTHIVANIFITMNSGDMGEYTLKNQSWGGNNFANAYVKLRTDADVAALEKKLPPFLEKYGGQQMKQLGMTKVLHLQPVSSIHTSPGYENEMGTPVSPTFLNILLIIAGLIQ